MEIPGRLNVKIQKCDAWWEILSSSGAIIPSELSQVTEDVLE